MCCWGILFWVGVDAGFDLNQKRMGREFVYANAELDGCLCVTVR